MIHNDEQDLINQVISIREQAQEAMDKCVYENRKAFERLAQTGQPLDDQDRLLIRQACLIVMGNALSSEV